MWTRRAALVVTSEDRQALERLVRSGKTEQRLALRARIVLGAADGASNRALAKALKTSRPTVLDWRQRFAEGGVDALSDDRPRGRSFTPLTHAKEAEIIARTQRVPTHTDGWKGYAGLANVGYSHRITVINAGPELAHEVKPRVHTVAALLKRWLLGTLQGGIQHQHLDYYLDEFTFRFNRRRSQARGLLFHRLAQQAVAIEPASYHSIISGVAPIRG